MFFISAKKSFVKYFAQMQENVRSDPFWGCVQFSSNPRICNLKKRRQQIAKGCLSLFNYLIDMSPTLMSPFFVENTCFFPSKVCFFDKKMDSLT